MYLKTYILYAFLLFFLFSNVLTAQENINVEIKEISTEKVNFNISQNNNYKIKDVVRILGYKNNQLIGYGLVIGLNQTGDSKLEFNKEILNKILQKFNIQLNLNNFQPKNVASVLVTAEIPPFAKKGDRITCYISSIGDAKSLMGGVLVQTPLYGANGTVYALAQGVLSPNQEENRFMKSNTAYILHGAILEKDLEELGLDNQIRLQLLDFDFEKLNIIYNKIKSNFSELDISIEGGSLLIKFSDSKAIYQKIQDILNLQVELPLKNKIIVDQKTKTIFITGNFILQPFLFAKHDKPTQYSKIQREAYQGIYIYTPSNENKNIIFFNASNMHDFVKELNQYNLSIQEIILIFQSMVESGVIQAEVVIR